MKSTWCTASFLDCVFSDVVTKSKLISICSWAIFWECMALHFVLSSATYSELIFVKFVGSVSGFIFLHVDVQLLQFCLLKGLSFLHSITFTPWSKITWLYLWGSISGLFTLLVYLSILLWILHYLDYCSFTVRLRVRYWQSSDFAVLQYCVSYSGSFASLYEF